MPRKIVDTILPTTMVGSYPRPHWFHDQLNGRDVRVAFKNVDHHEAYEDATQVVIGDQEDAGLDIVTDGQMYFDDYVGVIGSFCWYWYERLPGFEEAKEEHPSAVGAAVRTKEVELLEGRPRARLRARADLQRRDEGARRRRRDVPADGGPGRLAAAVHGQRGRLRVDR